MKPFSLISIGLFTLSINFLNAQAPQNAREATQNAQQIRRNHALLARDQQELNAFHNKKIRIREAWATKDIASVRTLKRDLLSDMDREIAQAKAYLNQTQVEVQQSKRELAGDQAELARDRRDARHTRKDAFDDARDLHHDRMDKLDDQQDLADDKRDRQQAAKRLERMTHIRNELYAYEFILNNTNAMHKFKLLDEFEHIMQKSINALARELNEDIQESKEDARERKDDRRERRERY